MDKVKDEYDKILVILFGSRARGDYSAFSDTDILIVLDSYGMDDLRRILSIAYGSDLISPEIHLFSKQYALENFERNTVLLDAVYEGKVLIDTLNVMELFKARLERFLERGFKRTKLGWVRES